MDVKEVNIEKQKLGTTMGSGTGEDENAIEAGGWAGTDDATSTAPSDLEQKAPVAEVDKIDVDPSGRAYAGGLGEEGGVADIAGRPVEESRNWEEDSIVENESNN